MQTIPVIQASAEVPSIWDRTQRILDNFGLPRWVRRQQKQTTTTTSPCGSTLTIDREGNFKATFKVPEKSPTNPEIATDIKTGKITVNQARAMVGLGPISPGGDSIYQGVPLKTSAITYTKPDPSTDVLVDATKVPSLSVAVSTPIAGSVKSQILEVVKYKSIPVSAREIAAEMPDVPYSTVTTRISEMARSGQLHYTGKFIQYGKVVNGYEIGGK